MKSNGRVLNYTCIDDIKNKCREINYKQILNHLIEKLLDKKLLQKIDKPSANN